MRKTLFPSNPAIPPARESRGALRAVMAGLALMAGACGDSASRAEPDAGSDAQASAHEDESEFEGCPKSTPEFALGMQAEGEQGHITGTLIAASKTPPLRYINDWTVEFVDGAGQSIEDVAIRMARPFMPVHGHDGNLEPKVSMVQPGRFTVDDLNLHMRGPWEIQFQLRSASAGDDYVVFHVCVEE